MGNQNKKVLKDAHYYCLNELNQRAKIEGNPFAIVVSKLRQKATTRARLNVLREKGFISYKPYNTEKNRVLVVELDQEKFNKISDERKVARQTND